MNETLEIIQSEFAQASFETFEMVLISMIAAAILGTILGLVLHLASNPIFYKNRVVNGITGTIINVIRSLPFIILIIVLQPLARLVVGTSIGPIAASVSLAIAAIAFYARLAIISPYFSFVSFMKSFTCCGFGSSSEQELLRTIIDASADPNSKQSITSHPW